MKTSKLRSISSLAILVVALALLTGCEDRSKLPVFKSNLTPSSVLILIEKRAFLLGGGDCNLDIMLSSPSSKVKLSSSLIFDAPDKLRVQLSYPGELPVMEAIVKSGNASFYMPGALAKYSGFLEQLICEPIGFIGMIDSLRYLNGTLRGFSSYGVKMTKGKPTHFAYVRNMGRFQVMAIVDRTTLTIAQLIYSEDDKQLFCTDFSDYIMLGDGVIPRRIRVSSESFNVDIKVKAAQQNTHSLTDYFFNELPGTQSVKSIAKFMELFYGKNNN